jgi:hypothetical protein
MYLFIHSPIRLRGVMLNYLSTGKTLPFTAERNFLLFRGGSLQRSNVTDVVTD